jgi:3-oxoacyl-[acyl-carrier protein] reductase
MAEDRSGAEKLQTELPKNLLRNRVAIVTGASRGIGKATAIRLAEAGADIVVNFMRSEEDAEKVAQSCRNLGVQAITVRGDMSDLKQAQRLADATLERFGRIDILVANAGIWEGAPVEELSEDLWDKVIDANLKGTWTICKSVIPAMKRQRSGSIVIISSTAGQRGEAGYSNYAASKGGQISFTKSLAVELAPEVRVNSVAPGWVDTQLNDPVFGDRDYKRKVADAIPLRRIATADDVALSVVFLASDWSRHISGEILNVNGAAVLCG